MSGAALIGSDPRLRGIARALAPLVVPLFLGVPLAVSVGRALVRGYDLPTPQSPPNGYVCEDASLRLLWHPTPGSGRYHVTIASDPDFRRVMMRRESGGRSLEVGGLPPGRRYWWRVRRGNVVGPSSSFEISRTRLPN